MVKTREEIIELIRNRIGDSTEDSDIELLEDVSDTLNEYENRLKDDTDWKRRYDENDANWRRRYIDRFKNAGEYKEKREEEEADEENEEVVIKGYEELFREEKK